jgi:hypothetical protein
MGETMNTVNQLPELDISLFQTILCSHLSVRHAFSNVLRLCGMQPVILSVYSLEGALSDERTRLSFTRLPFISNKSLASMSSRLLLCTVCLRRCFIATVRITQKVSFFCCRLRVCCGRYLATAAFYRVIV